ncbi:dihydroceramide delta-4 desaturase [Blumeria hordei DH14]|uniref:Sphingolipid delta(4)-desaturase n=1 Tax=Blumeria graminis f. sp. hordei (strain DH14) TaxID=546991 RepID=N1J4T1_BLUG1|nr:dihydroceramide delta-4 desaturase [Blumeria hordei DH14]
MITSVSSSTTISPSSDLSITSRAQTASKPGATKNKPSPSENTKEHDFFWTYTEEPHRTRRQAIIKAHPEVTKLCGPEPLTKYTVLLVVLIQLFCAFALQSTPILSWKFLLTAYVVGATANQNLFLAIHEISHNLAFRNATANRALAIFANLPIGIPYSASFRLISPQPYHLTHHKSLGIDGLDTDLPTSFEAFFLDSLLGKSFFATFQIFFYAIRPIFVYRVPFTYCHIANIVAQVVFDYLLVTNCSPNSLYYLIISSFLAGSLHPCAGHFIAEHYLLDPPSSRNPDSLTKTTLPETFSYYGPLNLLTYNVGLHNEHHDFPAVPWTRLPALHQLAKEFYIDLPQHSSWVSVIWQFVWDKDVGLSCRVKRSGKGKKLAEWEPSEVQA